MDPGTSTVASGFSSWAIVLRSSRDAPFTLCAVSEDSPGKRGALWGRGFGGANVSELCSHRRPYFAGERGALRDPPPRLES